MGESERGEEEEEEWCFWFIDQSETGQTSRLSFTYSCFISPEGLATLLFSLGGSPFSYLCPSSISSCSQDGLALLLFLSFSFKPVSLISPPSHSLPFLWASPRGSHFLVFGGFIVEATQGSGQSLCEHFNSSPFHHCCSMGRGERVRQCTHREDPHHNHTSNNVCSRPLFIKEKNVEKALMNLSKYL